MKALRHIVTGVLALVAMQMTVAQVLPPTISSQISADTVMIGDRVSLTIDVEKDLMQEIAFPELTFSSSDGSKSEEPSIEVLRSHAVDTISRNGRRVLLRKRYDMIVYDEGIYHLGKPSALYIDKNVQDTIVGEMENTLVVNTFQIDTTKTPTVRDLKPQKTLEFRFGEIQGYVLYSLLGLLCLALIAFLIYRQIKDRNSRIYTLFRPAPPAPPHIVAIAALEKLHNEKLWQNNKHKLYYSGLSDILRTYLDGRFGLSAMEMTTDEIIEALRRLDIDQKQKSSLVAVLRDADLVKFAKAMPEADANELAYNRAYYFVEDTKPVEVTEEEPEDEPTKNEKEVKQ